MNDIPATTLYRLIRGDQRWLLSVHAETWPRLLELAEAAELGGLLSHAGLHRDAAAPESIRESLQRRFTAETRHHGFHFVEAERVTAMFEGRGISTVVLKGVALARTVYEHPACRGFRDLDILVPSDRVDEASRLLLDDGYSVACAPRLAAVYRRDHFHLPFEARGRPDLELHWGVTRPDDPYHLDPAFLLQGRHRPAERPAFPCPSAESQLLHAVTAQLRCGFTEVRRLADVDRLVRRGPGVDWTIVTEQARAGGLMPALRLLCELCAATLGTPLEEPLASLPPLGAARRRLDELGIEGFPVGLPPSNWGPARHLVRFWLLPQHWRVLAQFWRRPRVERGRVVAMGVPRRTRMMAAIKRSVLLAWMAAWQVSLVARSHGGVVLNAAAGRPSSGPPAEDRAGTPGPAA